MKKIFKYDLLIGGTGQDQYFYANCPNGIVIRTDYVDDSFYKGNFVWLIVDPEDKNISERKIDWINSNKDEWGLLNCQIGVLEKQTINLPVNSEIVMVKDSEGMFWLYYRESDPYLGLRRVKIRGYKTGQEILENIDTLRYIGFAKIWVKQELGVYFFEVI